MNDNGVMQHKDINNLEEYPVIIKTELADLYKKEGILGKQATLQIGITDSSVLSPLWGDIVLDGRL